MKAMVVDDSKVARFVLTRMLNELGYDVVEAVDGAQALTTLAENQDCLLALVDWNMPVMNGLELVQAIRQQEALKELKIIMVSTETEMEQVVRAIEAGANEYIMKPFTKDIVFDKMRIIGLDGGA